MKYEIKARKKIFNNKNINEAFMYFTFLNIMEECDPNGERIYQVRIAIYKSTACYKTPNEEKKKR